MKTINSLIKIRINDNTGQLTANWEELPRGPWTKDIKWVGDPGDEELAALAIVAYRNLRMRTIGDANVCLKTWGVGQGLSDTMWYANDNIKRKVANISDIAILIASQPIPEEK